VSPELNNKYPDVTVVGAGWAGLSAAVSLSHHGCKVTLIEASQQIGGRARDILANQQTLDNGQHILIGAYKALLELLEVIGISESDAFIRTPLNLRIESLNSTGLHISAAKLTNPLHMLFAILGAEGLSAIEKWAITRFWLTLLLSNFSIKNDTPLFAFLKQNKQSERIISLFWAPLCIAALNTPIDTASSQVFLTVLKNSFTRRRANSDLLLPKTSLGGILPKPAAAFIQRHGGKIITGERVNQIHLNGEQIHSIETNKGKYQTSHLVLATPFKQTSKLLSAFDVFAEFTNAINLLDHEPITTLYMQYPDSVRIDGYMVGISDATTQWLIDRRTCGQAGLIAAVISASGKHMSMSKDMLIHTVLKETAQLFPEWPAPESTVLLREKQATFSCRANSEHFRPAPGFLGKKIWVAGDYLNTGLPATLEGAVMTGLQCAREIINSQNTSH